MRHEIFARLSSSAAALARDMRELPPYPLAAMLALLVSGVIRSADGGAPLTIAYGVYLACLSAGLGALAGWGLLLAFAVLRRRHLAARIFVWTALNLLAAVWLSDALGATARLYTRYDALARQVIAACAIAAALGTLLLLLMQPSPRAPHGQLARLPWWLRLLTSIVLAAGSVALGQADRELYVGLYLQGHLALRVWAFATLTFALVLALGRLPLPRLGRRATIALGVVFLVPCLALREDAADTVQAFSTRVWPATILRIARGILDLDRDGFSFVLAGGDCNDFDSSIYPTAPEIPGNGIDDNCAFGDLQVSEDESATVPVPKGKPPMNVVLITVDSWRFDRVGVNSPAGHRNGKSLTPKLDAWSKGAVNFKKAYTPGAWTSVAVGAFMRGLYARRLRWTAFLETNLYRMVKGPDLDLIPGERALKLFPLAWRDPHPPLSFWLQRRGMNTVAVVDDGFSQMLASGLGTNTGFDVYREVNVEPTSGAELLKQRKTQRRRYERDDSSTATMAISAIRFTTRGKPYFLWVHFFGPHTPSSTHHGIDKFDDGLVGAYDHEVKYVDSQLGRVLEAIEERGEPTAVFLTADHGEAFFDNYRSHGADLSEEVIHVPLLARVPGWKPQSVTTLVSLLDLMPTILALTRTPPPPELDGFDLSPLVAGGSLPPRLLLSDTWQYGREGTVFNDLIAAFDGKRKVVLNRRDHGFSVYDQLRPSAPPVRIEGLAIDALTRRVLGYIEETGGTLQFEK